MKTQPTRWRWSTVATAVTLSLGLTACLDVKPGGGDDDPVVDASKPIYALAVAVAGATFGTFDSAHVLFTNSLEAGTPVDLKNSAIELASPGAVMGVPKSGVFFVTLNDKGKVERWEIDDKGNVVPGRTLLSFNAFGVTAFKNVRPFVVSETKAFLYDNITLKLFVWNPQDMTIVGDPIDLAAAMEPDETPPNSSAKYAVNPSGNFVDFDGKLYLSYSHVDLSTFTVGQHSGMLIIDKETNEARVVRDARASGQQNVRLGADGMLYLATNPPSAALYMTTNHQRAGKPILTRFDPKKGEYDTNFQVFLEDVTGVEATGGMLPSFGSTMLVRAFNKDLAAAANPPVPPTDALKVIFSSVWDTFRVDLANPTAKAVKVDTANATAGELVVFEIDGKRFTTTANSVTKTTALIDLDQDPPASAFEFPGSAFSMVRVR